MSHAVAETTLPPSNLAAEEALLGACLHDPRALDDTADMISGADFYRPNHGELFAAMVTMRDKAQPVDAVSVAHFLGDRLQRLGGAPWLHDLMAVVVTSSNAAYHAEIIIEQSLRRRLIEAGQRAVQLARSEGEASDLIERARAALDEAAARARGGNDVFEIGELANRAIDRYMSPAPEALPTGLHDLDAVLSGGLRPGTLTVVAARPGCGKSIAAGVIAANVALRGKGVLFVSLEMTEAELVDRIISHLASVRLSAITGHKLSDDEWGRVEHAASRLRGLPLAIVDEPHMGLTGIRSRARDRLRTPRGLDLIVVDQLNLIQPASTRVDRQEQVAELSRSLKLLAKELHVPTMVLHQLNREPEKRTTGRPQLSDLRESGQVEANADIGILLHPQPADDARAGEIDFIVAKSRQGPQATITMSWQPYFARVGDLAGEGY